MGKELRRFAVWSNVFYLIPLAAALYFHLFVVAVALLTLAVFSTAFHTSDEKKFVLGDIAAAVLVVGLNATLWYLGGFRVFFLIPISILIVLALYIRYGREDGNRGGVAHGFWHLIAAAITLSCILSYALPF